jgi:hypothetical protein
MADDRENQTAGPGAEVTARTDFAIADAESGEVQVLREGERLTVLWFSGMGPFGVTTIRRERDGLVIQGVPTWLLTWA